jgi:hypothetical protein
MTDAYWTPTSMARSRLPGNAQWEAVFAAFERGEGRLPQFRMMFAGTYYAMDGAVVEACQEREYELWKRKYTDPNYQCRPHEQLYFREMFEWYATNPTAPQPMLSQTPPPSTIMNSVLSSVGLFESVQDSEYELSGMTSEERKKLLFQLCEGGLKAELARRKLDAADSVRSAKLRGTSQRPIGATRVDDEVLRRTGNGLNTSDQLGPEIDEEEEEDEEEDEREATTRTSTTPPNTERRKAQGGQLDKETNQPGPSNTRSDTQGPPSGKPMLSAKKKGKMPERTFDDVLPAVAWENQPANPVVGHLTTVQTRHQQTGQPQPQRYMSPRNPFYQSQPTYHQQFVPPPPPPPHNPPYHYQDQLPPVPPEYVPPPTSPLRQPYYQPYPPPHNPQYHYQDQQQQPQRYGAPLYSVQLPGADVFRGGKQDLEKWITETQALLDLYQWNDAVRLAAVVPLLKGDVLTGYAYHQRHARPEYRIYTWGHLVNYLRQRYTNRFAKEEAVRTFRALRCPEGGEDRFAIECQKIVPKLQGYYSDDAIYDEIKQKVKSKYVRDTLFHQERMPFEELYRFLIEAAESNRAEKRLRAEAAAQDQWRNQQPRGDYNNQGRNQARTQQRNNNPFQRDNIRQQQGVNQNRRFVCYACQQPGHLQAQCPYRQQRPQRQFRLMEEEEQPQQPHQQPPPPPPPPQPQPQRPPQQARNNNPFVGEELADDVAGPHLN